MARRPRLAVLGTAPAAAQIRTAADRLRWPIAPPATADLVYVTVGHATELVELARTGPALALDLDLVVELGAAGVGAVAAAAPQGVRRGEPLASAPAVSRWLRLVGDTAGVTHLSGLSRSAALNPALVAVMLYAARAAGWPSPPEVETDPPHRPSLRFAAPDGVRRAALDLGGDDELPQWELQAASPDRVARVALLPTPRLEINGDETPVPADHPAVAFGQEAFLRNWWTAVENGVPARHDPLFVTTLTAALGALRG